MVEGIDDQWDADLMDMSYYAKQNDGYTYILTVIDIFSKYVWLRPLKTKTSLEVKDAFQSIERKPKLLRTDKGKEFTSNVIEKFFKTIKIHHFVTQNSGKANYAERVIKTIKNHLQRYMTHHQTHRYIDIVPDVNKSYNQSYHRGTVLVLKSPGADPENVEPGGANSINYQTEPEGGAQIYFLVLYIRTNRGACAGCAPL